MQLVCGSIYFNLMEFAKAGDVVDGHAHNFDHTTIINRGEVLVEELDGQDGKTLRSIIKRATDRYNWIFIAAGKWHRITARVDDSMGMCAYSHRNKQGEVIEHYDGWEEAYL